MMLATTSSFFSKTLVPFSFLVVAIVSSFSSVPMQSLRSIVDDCGLASTQCVGLTLWRRSSSPSTW